MPSKSSHKSVAPDDREKAIASLFRVRAAESAPDKDGLKQVWHQGAKGADLLTYVNLKGQVERMEFTLFEDHFIWTPVKGLVSASVLRGGGSRAGAASDEVRFDPHLSPARVLNAHDALLSYSGQDRYIQQLRQILALAKEGISESEFNPVTTIHKSKPAGVAEARPAPSRLPLIVIISGVVVLLGGVAAAVLLLG